MVAVNRHQTSQLTMCTSIGFKGEMSHTRDGTERLFQQISYPQRTLYCFCGLQGMQVLKLWQGSYLLINFGIVLHGARAQRIKTCVDTKVVIREVGIVAYYCQLVTLRQLRLFLSLHRSRYLVIAEMILGQTIAFATLLREFKDQISV